MCLKWLIYPHYPILRLGFAEAFCYEALRVPPLLPEYISQPIQVAIQSLPATDSWPVWLSAAATLFGSFGGALLGGVVAYKSTIKANSALLKRQKLEEALSILLSLEVAVKNIKNVAPLQAQVGKSIAANAKIIEYVAEMERLRDQGLSSLIQLYYKKLNPDAVELDTCIAGLDVMTSLSSTLQQPIQPAYMDVAKNIDKLVLRMKNELINQLSL